MALRKWIPEVAGHLKAIDKAAGVERKVIETKRVKGGGTEHINRGNLAQDFRPGAYQKGENVLDVTEPATDAAKLWDGYGTALKPAWEPVILGMKPLDGTFAENALEHGVAGLNIDGSRIESGARPWRERRRNEASDEAQNAYSKGLAGSKAIDDTDIGRWPANLLLDEEAAEMFPDAPGQLIDQTNAPSSRSKNCYGKLSRSRDHEASSDRRYTDKGGTNFSAFPGIRRLDTDSASRFFYTAKADSNERGTGNNHPTVKPLDLMRYLCKMLCPPNGGLFLEPFAGSGTTLIACKALNIRAVGIELSEEYAEIAAKRLSQDVLEFT